MAQNTLTYLCLKENVICLQPRRDTSWFLEGGRRSWSSDVPRWIRAVLVCYYWKTMCWNLPAILSNIVDIFRGLTNKKKPKYNGIPSKCGILVLFYMIVGIKLERLAFGFLNGGLLFVTEGEYLILFFTTSSSLFFLKLCFIFSVLQRWPGVRARVKGWYQDLYSELSSR